jgi:hypothetical protein
MIRSRSATQIHDDVKSDNAAETPFDESKQYRLAPSAEDKIPLRTLGDGPCAPAAASEAAAVDGEDLDLEISPGYKGWINLVGVSREFKHTL